MPSPPKYKTQKLNNQIVSGVKAGVKKMLSFHDQRRKIMIIDYQKNDYLEHHGIKGMKWGIRRFQNKGGSLTNTGKKRLSKLYKQEAEKAATEWGNQYTKQYMDAYNRAAENMNNSGISKFNKQQEKKYGKNYEKRSGYEDDLTKVFSKKIERIYNQSLNDFYKTNEHARRAQELVDKYGMEEWDELAKNNSETIFKLRKVVEGK